MKKKWAIAGIALVAAAVLVLVLGLIAKKPAAGSVSKRSYDFTTIALGSIEKSISASGTLEPVSTVSVLSQMSGRVEAVYADFNDHVKKGQVLVTLNTDMLELERLEAQAAVTKAQASYDLQLLDFQNKTTLAGKGAGFGLRPGFLAVEPRGLCRDPGLGQGFPRHHRHRAQPVRPDQVPH